ncbi:hypothetical protein [uncultured Chryseobacterium sp.]|uniref:glycosyltransferase n=1 Tax=uncultured Chryseobacterium sp. TaxID=259322 RepID=UPI0025EC4A3B|nr:hypothetical protein [uncultured Chryseobacterium sp.]
MGDVKNIIFLGGKIKLEQYIKKEKELYIVFNGPSVEKCHGWKLAEYLSLGKAIISTRLHNDLPFPLIHGHHIHYVNDNYDSIKEGIKLVLENPKYVDKLQKGAIEYWDLYVNPTNIVKRIVEFALENK